MNRKKSFIFIIFLIFSFSYINAYSIQINGLKLYLGMSIEEIDQKPKKIEINSKTENSYFHEETWLYDDFLISFYQGERVITKIIIWDGKVNINASSDIELNSDVLNIEELYQICSADSFTIKHKNQTELYEFKYKTEFPYIIKYLMVEIRKNLCVRIECYDSSQFL